MDSGLGGLAAERPLGEVDCDKADELEERGGARTKGRLVIVTFAPFD
jgi:hypothetical protein